MSFALTTEQIRNKTKTVTRRMGWLHLKAGELIRPVKKCQGLKKGEKIEPIGPVIRIVDVRREPLDRMLLDHLYGWEENAREGFSPIMSPGEFVGMFMRANGCKPTDLVTRIEFEYV